MRILHVTGELPYLPGAGGGSTRQFYLLAGLAAAGHDVTVVAPVFEFQRDHVDLDSLYGDAGMRLRGTSRARSRWSQLFKALAHKPSLLPRLADLPYYAIQAEVLWTSIASEVHAEIRTNRPDVITVEHDINAIWATSLQSYGVPLAITLHNYTPDYYRSRAGSALSLRAARFRVEQRRMERYVRRHLPAYDHVVVVSERDAELVRARYSGPVTIVPNGTIVTGPVPLAAEEPVVLYTGTMNHPPNREGAIWLVREVWPQVRRDRPDALLKIVGRSPRNDVLALASRHQGIDVIGDAPSLLPYYSQAAVVVAPIFSGGGTRLKLLDAMAAGRSVVATSLAADGLSIADGREVLLRDEPAAFARAIIDLLGDPERRRELADEGRSLVTREYGWPKLAGRWERALQETIAARSYDALGAARG